jgi:hypothetical protein
VLERFLTRGLEEVLPSHFGNPRKPLRAFPGVP